MSNKLKITETEIRRQVQEYLKLKGWTILYHLQGLGSMRGMSDLQVLKDGRCIFLEVKTPKGRQSDYQKAFQQAVEAAGFEYWITRGIEDLQERGI